MARWKKPTKEEILEHRRNLADRARQGALRLPGAVVEIRKSVGMTQDEFAKMLGLTRRQVAEIEAGTANPTLETLEKIGRLFGFAVGFVPRTLREDVARSPFD
ncbi:helix-turn-helix transcriptional regulator [Rhizobium rhizogenes]|uniref:helix-turn-helix transcriptional regulator n=1 Tax=Rhizobium rhizogenes TaxID=359 RepID=UPI001572D5DD|nr:helix-turn-helix transcriptional regulator [Rhizobium rhizogenes]NTH22852.1 helix-turn-helix transcriptional regulator [Rhizobium rhizogenes]NTH35881.1 helix-turn-helix transcriptional regulator [Rhizobium rhizogenes]